MRQMHDRRHDGPGRGAVFVVASLSSGAPVPAEVGLRSMCRLGDVLLVLVGRSDVGIVAGSPQG
ncbi:hypothetical protein BRADO5103 [Bradyrhizobium sp. ORS 278]|nr:hypothetical protein BRADO5103 [Bradyrhizobium sp. ORS 278]